MSLDLFPGMKPIEDKPAATAIFILCITETVRQRDMGQRKNNSLTNDMDIDALLGFYFEVGPAAHLRHVNIIHRMTNCCSSWFKFHLLDWNCQVK